MRNVDAADLLDEIEPEHGRRCGMQPKIGNLQKRRRVVSERIWQTPRPIGVIEPLRPSDTRKEREKDDRL